VFLHLITKMARLELKRMTIIYFNVVVIRKEMIWLSCYDVDVVS
jgi:hypothetical protein